ncbi:MAG TPA: hypothetical protein VLF89_07055 [Candidatus Saccharimonadales bacterium]|nr:hypothetical protein [Candidatus Saccharimonadales bacterium]
MKIIKKEKQSKREDAVVIPFLEHYYSWFTEDISFSSVAESHENRPDYFVDTTKTLIEIKEIHDRTSNQRHAQWGKIANRLQKATDNSYLLKQVKGTYLVNTPDVFKLHKFEDAASQVLQAIIDGVNQQRINILGINFEINKVSDQEGIVVYGSIGGGGFIDPAGTVYQNIKEKIATANKQLGFTPNETKISKRILLLVNKYAFPLYEWDLFKAISLVYYDLLGYENIDEVWYQLETQSNGYIHKLLYSKYFFEKFEKESLNSVHESEYLMFGSWFSPLSEMNDEKKQKLFKALQFFLATDKANTHFAREHREQMVRLGLWLLEQNRIKDTIWLIDQFIDDTDPAEPEKYKGRPEFNYDKIIRDGKDAVVISTVMGHLAWNVKELARKSERHDIANLVKAYKYTEKILTSKKNLFVIQQWLIPLIEISSRRLWLAEDSPETYLKFRKLMLDPNNGLIAKYNEYPALTKYLTEILQFFKDLNTEEVKFVIEKLIDSKNGMVLLVYYALYKENHYKKDSDVGRILFKINPNILNYSSEYSYNKLKQISIDKENRYANYRLQLAFQCWRILNDETDEFKHLETLLDNLFNSPYEKKTFSDLFRILEKIYVLHIEQCHKWLMIYLSKLDSYADNYERGRNVWISMEKIIDKVAEYKPEDLTNIISHLTNIWLQGAYIGDLNVIYNAYKFISNPTKKAEIKELSQKLYKQLQEVNPRVKDINWIE